MGFFYGIEMAKQGEPFSDDECEWLIRRLPRAAACSSWASCAGPTTVATR